MTAKDLKLIEMASKVSVSYDNIIGMIRDADSDETKNILADLADKAFVRAEQTYFDVI